MGKISFLRALNAQNLSETKFSFIIFNLSLRSFLARIIPSIKEEL